MSADTFAIGGELGVHRLAFGAMRLPGVRGKPETPDAASRVLREALRLGVDFIDTARIYGDSELLIAEALHPYPDGLVIATKGGLARGGHPDGRPERLRSDCEESLQRLRVNRIDIWQLHRVDPAVPPEEQFGVIRELRDEGKIRFVGVSEVTVEELRRVRRLIEIATVQNRFNVAERRSDPVLSECEAEGIAFMPYAPIGMGDLAMIGGPLAAVAARHEASPAQIALAWLIQHSPVMLPIPGTGSLDHLRENMEAGRIELSEEDIATLDG
jgi:pyridoxine 4-dehydrogenase